MLDDETWWAIFRRFIFQSIVVYSAMFALIYIVGNIIAKTVQIMYFYGMRLYRFVNGPVPAAELEPESDESRMHMLENMQNAGEGNVANPTENEKDE